MIARKVCPVCRMSLLAEAFNRSARTSDGFAHMCRACTNARRRQRNLSRDRRSEPALPLASALRQGHISAVRGLLDSGMKPHWASVCEAMRGGHLALAEVL